MLAHTKRMMPWTILVLCLFSVLIAWLAHNPWPAAAGGVGLCYLALRIAYYRRAESGAAH